MAASAFLADADLRDVTLPANTPFRLIGLALGQGESTQLEVLAVEAAGPPSPTKVRTLWKDFNGRRPAPLLVVALHADSAVLCGPTAAGDEPPVHAAVERGQAERLCREALEQPDRHSAHRYLRDALPAVVDSLMPGVRNEGLLATHELARGARKLGEWDGAGARARPLLARREEALLKGLGFKVEAGDGPTSVLRAGPNGKKLAVAVLLRPDESPEIEADRFSGLSPVSYALTVADREGLPYVIVSQATKLRLYPVRLNVGVGRRGRTETFVEVHPGHLRADDAAYLWLLFSGEALAEGGTLDKLLEESKRFAGELAVRLRERIYGYVVPQLAQGLAEARKLKKPAAKDLAETYQMAMTVLFRLLFIAYAEDKDLLPYRFNGLYHKRSLKTKARELVEAYPHGLPANESPFGSGDARWKEVGLLFRAVADGNREWHVPEYGGGLFSRDADVSPAGALLETVTLPDTVMGLVLWHLLVIESPEGWGPVDFRSLSVREFGTVYEGLLESELSVAEVDLTTDREGYYRPCQAGETPVVKKSRIYLHNRSGARKASGTYFTKEFAVDHLLDSALEPALKDHLARLDALDETDAAERFFDFRVADIAMGSAHFLVAAVDRIERRFTGYLANRPLPGVHQELARLRASAVKELGDLAEQLEIEDTQLLRRLIARRCIYGVDLNPVAVNLARLSIWIHTFVPGLPLSMLERNLIVGNSLVGVGRISEIEEKAKEDDLPLFRVDAKQLVGEALEPLQRLARLADATIPEVRQAHKAMADAESAVRPAEALCDIVTASRIRGVKLPIDLTNWDAVKSKIVESKAHAEALAALSHLPPFHFPIAFPEVFLRDRSGFDVILGNPPWEEATVEEDRFWNAYVPGLQGMPQGDQERVKAAMRRDRPDLVREYEEAIAKAEALREALLAGPFPGMGTGDPDLYKGFSWRFFHLAARAGGCVGVVLPRSAFSEGIGRFPQRAARTSCSYGFVLSYLILEDGSLMMRSGVPHHNPLLDHEGCRGNRTRRAIEGAFRNYERFAAEAQTAGVEFSTEEVLSWTDTAALPFLPAEESARVLAQLRLSPRLDMDEPGAWRARPHTELHATNDKHLILFDGQLPKGCWPVFKGESFDIWEPDRGRYYGWSDPKKVVEHLLRKRRSGRTKSNSVWFAFQDRPASWFSSERTLPCYHPRIAFKDIVRNTDSRTVKVAFIPPHVFVTNKGPYFLWIRGDEKDKAYLLGVLSSVPLDWYARRFVELTLNFFILNPFPIPRPNRANAVWKHVVALAGRLAAPDDRFAEWAKAVGVACGPLPEAEKQDHIHELDAVVAHLYGLEEKHLIHVFETFHEGWDYASRLDATLKHYRQWKGKAP